ncbi:tripartite tricarboxylate transporter substrate binding protein [Aquincola sp. MAHUQ-54]|uniref:Tripartite tricarboxylate transporter substrate binding protein n=1 Tax=Aquincola agrisoli TaxID=3119538 RepID=A0AAW9QNK2_9BURK
MATLAALLPVASHAQEAAYPAKPLTIIVPFSAGGGVDVMARLLAEELRAAMGQTVNVENKAGGSGMIGTVAAVRAPADGYTLLMATAGETAINPHVYKAKMQYAPEKDLAPISLVVKVPNVVVVNPKLPVKTMAELLAYAKANPGKVSYGTSGIGNPQHLAGELLAQLSGTTLTHIPYRGASNQLTDTAGGSIDMTFVSLTGARPFMKDQRVRAIAMTSPARSALAPELPAVAETPGLEKYTLENWFGLFAPAATPPAIVQKLNAAVVQALKDPELARRLNELGGEPAPMAPAQFKAFVQAESVRFAKIVDDAKITPEN